jgi:hypothetical protein
MQVAPDALTSCTSLFVQYEVLDSAGLARKLGLKETWVREHVRKRVPDPIPHYKMGKYVKFLWGSPPLEEWLSRRLVCADNRKANRALGKETIQ